ncbi:MAG: 4-hydroxy-tetrahydrodipicolinate reductase [Defluviitaleaceae bacterium]|nr:4-hydroxy-tetrahydrodipicolinate reductase [Defluviitaleaceae bacterium]
MKIIIHGLGRLGLAVAGLASDGSVVGAVDTNAGKNPNYHVFGNLGDCDQTAADVIIDCSHASAVGSLAEKAEIPLVICTTGMDGATISLITEASQRIPVFMSANMSLGVNLQAGMASYATKLLGNKGFDIEIIEAHHNQKLDAPSGTAMMLAESIKEASGGKLRYVYDRSQYMQKRGPDEIGISAIRGGTIVGEHTIIFAGHDEVIEITHRALSRDIFAKGALAAAEFVKDKPPGLYNMNDMLKS